MLPLRHDEIAQLDNDPNFPERGRLVIQVHGGRCTCPRNPAVARWRPVAAAKARGALTPTIISANRPGLDLLRYRVGTHNTFFDTMKARLAMMEVVATGADGQTLESFRPLEGLTTRATSDPAIAMLGGWAMVGDVLTFYQERIANEGYLRTATERRSVLELARLVGLHAPPGGGIDGSGVHAGGFRRSYRWNSGRLPFAEHSGSGRATAVVRDKRSTRGAHGVEQLEIRHHRPQNVTLDNVPWARSHLRGRIAVSNLKKGDQLLFVFGDDEQSVIRTVADSLRNRTMTGRW